ncbi:MAG: transposase [Prolixibacteraceae bacterium]|nr:transposase [Prolixibacteraceae bacterium]
MQFTTDHIYHIFNRGNNSQPIFFSRENYLFFLQKIKTHITPYADILAWCLMPNHFHLMIYVNNVEVEVIEQKNMSGDKSKEQASKFSEQVSKISEQVTESHLLTRKRLLNDSISIMLRSYTRAIQKQNKITGSLFQHRTKAVCLTEIDGITPAWFQTNYGTVINIIDPEKEYPQICFNYIHQNPVKGGLVNSPSEWEFSSYRDYTNERNGQLINRERAEKFGLRVL